MGGINDLTSSCSQNLDQILIYDCQGFNYHQLVDSKQGPNDLVYLLLWTRGVSSSLKILLFALNNILFLVSFCVFVLLKLSDHHFFNRTQQDEFNWRAVKKNPSSTKSYLLCFSIYSQSFRTRIIELLIFIYLSF